MITPVARMRQRLLRHRPEDSLPATVTHQRIYILPSGRGVAFLIALLLMLVASVNYALSLGYALCFLLTGLHTAALLQTYRNLSGISINNIRAQNVYADESLEYRLVLSSDKAAPHHDIELKDRQGHQTRVSLDPRSGPVTAILPIDDLQRGRHNLGRVTLTSNWPLGLWRTWSYLHVPASALVYPHRELNPPVPPARDDATGEDNPRRSQVGEFAGLRTYRAGDSPSHIAWKHAARGLGLLTRQHDDPSTKGDVYLDLATAGSMELEARLSRLAAWIEQCEHGQQRYALKAGDHFLDLALGAEHQHEALSVLAMYGSGNESL